MNLDRSGIYQILNLMNGHCYIGQAYNLKERKREHFSALRRGKYGTTHWQNAFNKYGEKVFDFVVLDYIEDLETLTFWEQVYFNLFHPEYNSNLLAGRPPGSDWTGKSHSEETRRKISKAALKRELSGERNPFYGKHHNKETRNKIKKTWTPERRKKQSKARKGKTYIELYGPERAAEIQQKQSEARTKLMKGRTYDEIYGLECAAKLRQKRSEARKGRTYDELFGPERAAEIKRKLSEAAKRQWVLWRAQQKEEDQQ